MSDSAFNSIPPELPPPEPAVAAAPPPVPYAEYPEDLRVPWTWLDVLIFVLLFIGLQVLVAGVTQGAGLALGWIQAGQDLTTHAPFLAVNQVIHSALMLGYLYFAFRLRGREPFWRLMGFRAFRLAGVTERRACWLMALAGVPLSFTVSVLSGLARPTQKLPMEAFFQDARSVLILSALGILLAPLYEETVFRGFLYPVIARTFGVPGGVLITGALFGAMHAPQLWGGWVQISLLVLVGIVFTYARARTKSVTSAYFLHLGYNSYLFLAFFSVTNFLRNIPAP